MKNYFEKKIPIALKKKMFPGGLAESSIFTAMAQIQSLAPKLPYAADVAKKKKKKKADIVNHFYVFSK